MFAARFETEEKNFRQRKTFTSLGATVFFHGLLLLFLIFYIWKTPIPPFTEDGGGMEMNFGFDNQGSGEEQPFSYQPGEMENASTPSSPATAEEEKILTQDNEETEVTATKNEEKPKTKPVNTTTNTKPTKTVNENPQPKVDEGSLFNKGAYGNPNNSKGDGITGGSGDQGNPNGDVNSKNYLEGDGPGTGPGKDGGKGGVTLKGRKSTSLPAPKFCNAKGNVIIDITVDRNGNVTDAKYHRDGSTITDNCTIQNARTAAMKSKFNADANAGELQYGSINYVFTVQ